MNVMDLEEKTHPDLKQHPKGSVQKRSMSFMQLYSTRVLLRLEFPKMMRQTKPEILQKLQCINIRAGNLHISQECGLYFEVFQSCPM